MEIDFVITWVDGDDPRHKAKLHSYLKGYNYEEREDIAAPTRYRSIGEIGWCVASILRFAPYARKIFIVTDHQNPGLDDFIERYFPENTIPIEIIDHTLIFRGYEPYLPTFNSLAIETMLWRIPGLSEHFVYLNDDLILTSPTTPETWFREGKTVVRGEWHNTLPALVARRTALLSHREPRVKFSYTTLNSARLVKGAALRRFIKIRHTPHPMRRSLFARFFDNDPDSLTQNISYRFRHQNQFNPQALNYLLSARNDKAIVDPATSALAFYDATRHDKEQFSRLMRQLETSSETLFLCINSLDMAPMADAKTLIQWIERRLGVSIN